MQCNFQLRICQKLEKPTNSSWSFKFQCWIFVKIEDPKPATTHGEKRGAYFTNRQNGNFFSHTSGLNILTWNHAETVWTCSLQLLRKGWSFQSNDGFYQKGIAKSAQLLRSKAEENSKAGENRPLMTTSTSTRLFANVLTVSCGHPSGVTPVVVPAPIRSSPASASTAIDWRKSLQWRSIQWTYRHASSSISDLS